jgi:hypothetical protein
MRRGPSRGWSRGLVRDQSMPLCELNRSTNGIRPTGWSLHVISTIGPSTKSAVPRPAVRPMEVSMYFILFKSEKNSQWYWNLNADNHKVLATGAEVTSTSKMP